MNLIPYQRYSIETEATTDECRQRLASIVREPKPFKVWAHREPENNHWVFQGRVSTERFSLARIIHYRNSFLPVIQGRFDPFAGGTRIAMTLFIHPLVAIFMVVWLSAVGSIAYTVTEGWVTSGKFDVSLTLLWVMFLGGYGMMQGCFAVEAKKARTALAETFASRERTETPLHLNL